MIGKQSAMRGLWVSVEERKDLYWTNIQRALVRVCMYSIEIRGTAMASCSSWRTRNLSLHEVDKLS